ncbi:MAG TPA: hypothetical protein VGH27_35370 [Streptosporangiaceae bacterium]
MAWAEPDELDALPELDELPLDVPPELVLPLLVEPLLVEPLLVEPLLEPVLAEPVEVEPVEVLVVLESWVEPGSVAATAPVAMTLATPTPAVTAASRLIPRRRASAGGSVRPSVLLGIGIPSPWRLFCLRRCVSHPNGSSYLHLRYL